MLDYFYGQQADQFSFYRMPKILFTDKKFSNMSIESKVLYGIFLDRMNLSAKNGWLDENGRVYIIFPINEIMEYLNCSKQKVVNLLYELEKTSKLIERVRQGLGKPNLIYVKNFVACDIDFSKYEIKTSCGTENGLQEVPELDGNNINNNNTENSDINLSFHSAKSENELGNGLESEGNFETEDTSFYEQQENPVYKQLRAYGEYRSYFWDKLQFELLLEKYEMEEDLVYEILDIIVDTVCSNRQTIRICSDDKPIEIVRSQFMKLEREHIEFIMSCMKENKSKIKNIRQYLFATIYNARMTMGNYYSSLVQYHMATGQV